MSGGMCPGDEAELAELVRGANAPLSIGGGGTRGLGLAGTPLATGGLAGITLYDPGALTIVAKAGTPLADVAAALRAERQRLAFEPPDWRGLLGTTGEPTLGGMVATNASGPRRVQGGACRDVLLGVRFVDGAGTIVKNGGRVMKNVTGYDLVKLMAGSYGTLGVLTEASFKVLPIPEACATVRLYGLDDQRAVSAMARAMGSPFDVTGAAHFPGGATLLRLEGFAASVAYRAVQLRQVLAEFGNPEIDDREATVTADWAAVRDVSRFAGLPGDVWRLSVKPSDAPGLVARAGAEQVIYDWAGGQIWALLEPGSDLRARLGTFGGHATLVRAAPNTRARLGMFQPLPAALATLSRGLRARFDPRGIFNPGLMD